MSRELTKDPAGRVLLIDDEVSIHEPVKVILADAGYEVDAIKDSAEALDLLRREHFDVVLLDINMPTIGGLEILKFVKRHDPVTEVIMVTAVHDIPTAVECVKSGAFYYLTKPFGHLELIAAVGRAIEQHTLRGQSPARKSRLDNDESGEFILGSSPILHEVLAMAEQIAPSAVAVLIQGSTGTGKELLAQYIHRKSARSGENFVPINCAAIPEMLFESELFGFERGAFTDARERKIGLVELANNGTLFLDEIGDISPTVQPKLLRFLQTGEFRRVGGTANLSANVRVISATNKNLQQRVKEEKFREELLFRLNVITLRLPDLRERREDIPLLAESYLKKHFPGTRKSLTSAALAALLAYDWPGNIRELENVLERAVLVTRRNEIEPNDLLLPTAGNLPGRHSADDNPIGTNATVKELERMHIEAVLNQTGWDKTEAAKILGLNLKTLYTKIAAYNITRKQ